MTIVGFDPEKVLDYVPAYGGNRGSEAPCVVKLKFVSNGKMVEYEKMIYARGGKNGEKVQAALQEVQKRQFTDSVEAVENYKVGDREVTDPAEFYETADKDLIFEIIRAMENVALLTEGLRTQER